MKGSPQMKVRLVGLLALCALVLFLAFPASPVIHSQNGARPLNQSEQDLLKEINQARANPRLYATYLEKLKPLFKGKQYKTETLSVTTTEGWSAVEDAIKYLRGAKPAGPLSMSSGLSLAALSHVQDQSSSGATGHKTGNDGGMVEDRVKPYGTWKGGIGENLAYGTETARERVLTWLIDDGFATRGHRLRLMNADYKVAGICCGSHPEYTTMCVLTLAGSFVNGPAAKSAPGNTDLKTEVKNTATNASLSSSTPTQSGNASVNANVTKPATNSTINTNTNNSNKSKITTKPRRL
jgi:uncharacterized protein YkwD